MKRGVRRNRGNRGKIFLGLFGFLGILGFLLAGCTRQENPSPSAIYGPLTATGTIASTGASLYRRGTHVLLVSGRTRFFLESKSVDLDRYERQTAVVKGELELNTHESFLPVIVVAEVVPFSVEARVSPLQRYEVPALSLSLEAPAEWRVTLAENALQFRLEGEEESFLHIGRSEHPVPDDGIPLRVSGQNGLRVVEEGSGRHLVFVEQADGESVLFRFTPSVTHPALRDAFYALLHTVQLTGHASSSSSASSPSAPDDPFLPCGGPAHVLCPQGMYCEVKELDTGIGACRRLE